MRTLTKQQAQTNLDRLEDLMCNTDYTTSVGALAYQSYQREANKMQQILDGEI